MRELSLSDPRPESRNRVGGGSRSRSGVRFRSSARRHRPKAASYARLHLREETHRRHPCRTREPRKARDCLSAALEDSPRNRRGVPRPCSLAARGFLRRVRRARCFIPQSANDECLTAPALTPFHPLASVFGGDLSAPSSTATAAARALDFASRRLVRLDESSSLRTDARGFPIAVSRDRTPTRTTGLRQEASKARGLGLRYFPLGEVCDPAFQARSPLPLHLLRS